MIRGSIQDRMDYEVYIRSCRNHIDYPFCNLYEESRIVKRYFRIKTATEKRNYYPEEIDIVNLMSLFTYIARIGGLLDMWLWCEQIPEIIFMMPMSQPDYHIPAEVMAKTFMLVPSKALEATLLKAGVELSTIDQAMKAHQIEDLEVLITIFSTTPYTKIFDSYKLVAAYKQVRDDISRTTFLKSGECDSAIRYSFSDILDLLSPSEDIDREEYLDKFLVVDGLDPSLNTRTLIFTFCIGLEFVCSLFENDLGVNDPISSTINEVLNEPVFQRILNMYVQFPRDIERYEQVCLKCVGWLKENFGADISEEELDFATLETEHIRPMIGTRSERLEFPSRLINDIESGLIYAQEYAPVLKEIFKTFGGYFENMSCEDFLYLFGGTNERPANYNPPFYWTGEESTMKALVRLLYTKQPRSFKNLVLHISDKDSKATIHDWGRNKNKVAYRKIEETVIGGIRRVTGKTLKRL